MENPYGTDIEEDWGDIANVEIDLNTLGSNFVAHKSAESTNPFIQRNRSANRLIVRGHRRHSVGAFTHIEQDNVQDRVLSIKVTDVERSTFTDRLESTITTVRKFLQEIITPFELGVAPALEDTQDFLSQVLDDPNMDLRSGSIKHLVAVASELKTIGFLSQQLELDERQVNLLYEHIRPRSTK